MRVAFVSPRTTHTSDTGANRRLERTARLLAERGHDVSLCCTQWWDGDHPTFEQGGITYRRVTESPSPTAFASKLPFALRKARPDVIHAANDPPGPAAAAKTAGRFLRAPVVVDWWSVGSGDPAAGYRKLLRRADAVLAPSNTVRTAVRDLGAAEGLVELVPESIDFSLVESAPVDERADLVYARRLDERANVETFLLALAELRDRGWRAAVVGDGPARADAERAAADLRIDDRVEFLGDLSEAERVSLLKGAHVFAQTAEVEPFATDLLWALACGCVGVVEYQVASAAHELVEGKARVDVGERGSLVTTPNELADRMAAAADLERRTVDDRYAVYDHPALLDRYLDCYRGVVESYGLF